jgi:hypothetical protein
LTSIFKDGWAALQVRNIVGRIINACGVDSSVLVHRLFGVVFKTRVGLVGGLGQGRQHRGRRPFGTLTGTRPIRRRCCWRVLVRGARGLGGPSLLNDLAMPADYLVARVKG